MKTVTKRDRMLDRIREHGENLKAIYPDCELPPITLCNKLRRLEREAHDLAEECCEWRSTDDPETEAIAQRILSKVDKVLGTTGPRPHLNYDPRGYALKIRPEDAKDLKIYKDWSGYGIIAPDLSE